LAALAQEGRLAPEEMADGTFTVSNLGSFGIETFTPVLNPPQVAILGVGAIYLKAVEAGDGVAHLPHLMLSLTIDHQALDGAPAARFLAALAECIAHIDLVLAQ
jgi:pyruvate dehydrogenase E2 component (dihydrolipoamide acetyltransferase)